MSFYVQYLVILDEYDVSYQNAKGPKSFHFMSVLGQICHLTVKHCS